MDGVNQRRTTTGGTVVVPANANRGEASTGCPVVVVCSGDDGGARWPEVGAAEER